MNDDDKKEKDSNAPRSEGRRHDQKREKPKDLKKVIKNMLLAMKKYMVTIVFCILMGMGAAILSIIGPHVLSDLADTITAGISVNKDAFEDITKTITSNLVVLQDEEFVRTMTSLDYSKSSEVFNSDEYTKEEQEVLQSVLDGDTSKIKDLSDNVIYTLLTDVTYRGVVITKDERLPIFKAYINDKEGMEKGLIIFTSLPNKVKEAILPPFTYNEVEISTDDQIEYINTMSKVNTTDVNQLYSSIDTLPSSIKALVESKMDMDKIHDIVRVLVIIYILSSIFDLVEEITMADVSNNFAKDLRNEISKKINRLPLKYFDNHAYGDVLSLVTNDVDAINQALNNSLGILVASVTLLVGSTIMMFVTNVLMAVAAVVSSLVGFFFMIVIVKYSQKYFELRQKSLAKVNGHIEEIYSAHNVVKAYNGEKDAKEEFTKLNEERYDADIKSEFFGGATHPFMGFVGNLGYVAVCITGAILVIEKGMNYGSIVAFMIYIRLFTNPLTQIAQAITNIQTSAAGAERVFDFLEEPEMEDESNLKFKLNRSNIKGNIEFKHVKFGYDDDKIIIKDFNCKVKAGQKIAIVGPTGAGKTTMVNLLMKFYNIKDGDIIIDGTSIKEMSRDDVHRLFIMILQDTWLFNGTIRDNIKFSNENVSDGQIWEALKVVGIDHFVRSLPGGLDYVIGDQETISAGQKQLLTIARGMIENAPFLILDEATSSVDTRTEELVQEAMDKLTVGRTSFIIAHRLSTIRNADIILVMDHGNIIEQGNHEELMKKNGFYADLYLSQFKK